MINTVGIKIVIFTKESDFISSVPGLGSSLSRVAQAVNKSISDTIADYISGQNLYNPKSIDMQSADNITKDSRLDMLNDIQRRIIKSPSKFEIEIFSNDSLFYFLEYGTGLFGPEGREIVARDVGSHKPAFRFEIDGEVIYAKKTMGMHPVPIMRSSLLKLRIDLKKIMSKMGLRYISTPRDDKEQLDIEIIGVTKKSGKKGIFDGISWMNIYGKKLKKL